MDTLEMSFCKTKALRKKNPVERRSLVHGRIVKRIIFGKVFVSKMTHNLVFAGQPRRTATLPQHGHGPVLKLALVRVCSISICYRGWNPLNRKFAKFLNKRHTKCRINFLPGATVGSPAMAVCDTLPGSTNPIEEIDIY